MYAVQSELIAAFCVQSSTEKDKSDLDLGVDMEISSNLDLTRMGSILIRIIDKLYST